MRAVAVSTGPETHLDHLAILADLLNIPLIVTSEEQAELSRRYYPKTKTLLKEMNELSLNYLAAHWDLLFSCGKFWEMDLGPALELLFQKKMRFVFCPHGHSDKGDSLSTHVSQDIALIYGNHMRDQLAKRNVSAAHLVITGNYRYFYYKKHQEFYDALAEREIFAHVEKRSQTFLYAPTWKDKENPSSFFEACAPLIEHLPSDKTLLIKLHPLLAEHYPAHTYHFLTHYENRPGVLFIPRFPPIYPLLNRADVYLGDFSSIGYDFLAFDQPLYFFHPESTSPPPLLRRCGLAIPKEAWSNPYPFIDQTLKKNLREYTAERQLTYLYAFERDASLSLTDILEAAARRNG